MNRAFKCNIEGKPCTIYPVDIGDATKDRWRFLVTGCEASFEVTYDPETGTTNTSDKNLNECLEWFIASWRLSH